MSHAARGHRGAASAAARGHRGAVRVLVLAFVAVLVAACGVPADSEPRALDPDSVPFGLLQPTSSTSSTTVPLEATEVATVYLVGEGNLLVPVERRVPSPANAATLVRVLLDGPTETELRRGLSTAITQTTELRSVDGPRSGLLTIDLTEDLLDITGSRQIQALAQLVHTCTDLPAVDEVLFEFEGQRRDVPAGNGRLTSAPLSRRDYQSLLRPTTTTTQPTTTTRGGRQR